MKKVVRMSKIEFQIDRETRLIRLQKLKRSELILLAATKIVQATNSEAHYNELNHQIRYLLPSLLDGSDLKTRQIINQSKAEILAGLQNSLQISDAIIADREVKSAVQSKKNVALKANAVKNENTNKIKNEVKKNWLKWKENKKKFARTEFAKSMIQIKKFDIKERTITESWCKEWEDDWKSSH